MESERVFSSRRSSLLLGVPFPRDILIKVRLESERGLTGGKKGIRMITRSSLDDWRMGYAVICRIF